MKSNIHKKQKKKKYRKRKEKQIPGRGEALVESPKSPEPLLPLGDLPVIPQLFPFIIPHFLIILHLPIFIGIFTSYIMRWLSHKHPQLKTYLLKVKDSRVGPQGEVTYFLIPKNPFSFHITVVAAISIIRQKRSTQKYSKENRTKQYLF